MRAGNIATNPNSATVKKYIFEMIKENFHENEEIIERICHSLFLNKDLEAFAKLIATTYQAGFSSAVHQQTEQLKKVGIEFQIIQKSHSSH